MAVDLEAIARRGRCDVSSLKLALPLLEQGYEAPFLARYRRDELGGLDEASLWGLKAALDAEQAIADYREELYQTWQSTPLADPAIGDAIRKSGSTRTLQRLGKRLRKETASGAESDANRLAVRMLNPEKGDPAEPAEVAATIESISDAEAAVAGLADALPARLAGDPRVISAAVRWLSRNAKIHISNVHDPHGGADDPDDETHDSGKGKKSKAAKEAKAASEAPAENPPEGASEHAADSTSESQPAEVSADSATDAASPENAGQENASGEGQVAETQAPAAEISQPIADASPAETGDDAATGTSAAQDSEGEPDTPDDAGATANANNPADSGSSDSGSSDSVSTAESEGDTAQGSPQSSDSTPSSADEDLPGFQPDPDAKADDEKKKKAASQPAKKQRKVSPRQRRRRWLVSVLKPLEGKRLPASKLSSFQVVMLGRALRSQVAVCAFEYDAAKLVNEIKRTVVGLNKGIESVLGDVVMRHEADIREAAEAAWWDELHERASTRLVGVVSDHLRQHVNRGPLDAKVVMSIDAVGPKTAATAIVSADGKVLHGEDLPCQLSATARVQTVTKMGELIHQHGVDLVVVSNGPARRACLIALGELINQSPDNSIRWTVADRSGADTYSSSDVANSEMRSTPRRFRAAAWIAFSVLHPAQAYSKIDPLRLRLSSFQSELSDDALAISLGHIMSSGASRGGVDANVAPSAWLEQLPGMNRQIATELVKRREASLLKSRDELLSLESWDSAVQSRQALPFLRVFESGEPLDGTLIHPDDYALAKKLASTLEIELPPAAPPGYQSPTYEKVAEVSEPKLVDVTKPAAPAPVEEFDNVGEKATEFKITEGEPAEADSSETQQPADAAEDSVSEQVAEAESSVEAEAADTVEDSSTSEAEAATEPATESDASAEEGASEADAAPPEPTAEEAHSVPDPIRRPRPEQAKIDKCIKEWQIGRHRTRQLVDWLCDPFGETAISDAPPAVLSTMPTLKTLKPGDQVIGVVVGVMSFGVFVELAPDCSGLIHVSRLSDGYVEDLNEAIQVGDVVTAWVTGIDEKRRRVGLSALSPEQEAKLEQERQTRGEGAGRGGRGRQGGGRGAKGRSGNAAPATAGTASGGQARGGQSRGGQSRGGGQGQGGQARGGQGRGGQGRGGQGQGRGGQGRGGRGDRGGRKRQPESYRVVAKPETKPISDAMQKGDEPLRSFGDLMQFYSKQEQAPEAAKSGGGKEAQESKGQQQPSPDASAAVASEQPASQPPAKPAGEGKAAEQAGAQADSAGQNADASQAADSSAKTNENATGATE